MISKGRVLIVGLDGATFDIITPMAESGRLPTCARLMKEGAWGPLRSTLPPLTPPGWVSFMTGKNPGKHGIYGFYTYDHGSYDGELVTGLSVRTKKMWDYLGDEKIGLVDIPITFPPQEINGYMIAGDPAPSSESIFTHPPELHTEIIREMGDYMIEKAAAAAYSQTHNLIEAVQLLYRVTEERRKTGLYLLNKKGPFDLFCIVFRGTDLIQHGAFKFLDPVYCAANPDKCKKFKGLIFQFYEKVDAILSELIEAMGEDAITIVLSDHGGTIMQKRFFINRWLKHEGLLELKRRDWWRGLEVGQKPFGALLQRMNVGFLNYFIPSQLKKIAIPYVKPRENSSRTIDWAKTKAFTSRLCTDGVIRLNLRGREAGGIVGQRDYDTLGDDIIARLRALRDAKTGEAVFQAVYKREEIYHGPCVEDAPDILLVTSSESCGFSPALDDGPILERHLDPDCRHQMDGIFMIKGPGIKSGRILAGLDITDVAPTVLHLMDKPVPDSMDGKVIVDAIEEEYAAANPPRYFREDDEQIAKSHDQVFTAEEQKRVEASLRALGYIE